MNSFNLSKPFVAIFFTIVATWITDKDGMYCYQRKALVTDEVVKSFMDSSRIIDPTSSKPAMVQLPLSI